MRLSISLIVQRLLQAKTEFLIEFLTVIDRYRRRTEAMRECVQFRVAVPAQFLQSFQKQQRTNQFSSRDLAIIGSGPANCFLFHRSRYATRVQLESVGRGTLNKSPCSPSQRQHRALVVAMERLNNTSL